MFGHALRETNRNIVKIVTSEGDAVVRFRVILFPIVSGASTPPVLQAEDPALSDAILARQCVLDVLEWRFHPLHVCGF